MTYVSTIDVTMVILELILRFLGSLFICKVTRKHWFPNQWRWVDEIKIWFIRKSYEDHDALLYKNCKICGKSRIWRKDGEVVEE